MTPEQQRIAIAEACGFSLSGINMFSGYGYKNGLAVDIPDYLNCLNAMHEAEKVLSVLGLQWRDYVKHLNTTVGNTRFNTTWSDWFPVVNATAQQRAEAFLRTIGKWTE